MISNGINPETERTLQDPATEAALAEAQRAGITVYAIYHASANYVATDPSAIYSGQVQLAQLRAPTLLHIEWAHVVAAAVLALFAFIFQDLNSLLETERHPNRPGAREYLRVLDGGLVDQRVRIGARIALDDVQVAAMVIPGGIQPRSVAEA